MVEAAWAASRTATRPGARFRRLARRFGKRNEKKAAVAVAHTLLCIAWAVMKHDSDYADAGTDYYDQPDQRNHEHLVRHHQQALARLGYQVTLIPPGDGSPPPGQTAPPASSPPPDLPHLTGEPQAGCAGAAARQAGAPSFVTAADGLAGKDHSQVWRNFCAIRRTRA